MINVSEMDLLIYSMAAEMNDAYNQPRTKQDIQDTAIQWRSNYSNLSRDELYDIVIEGTRANMKHMNWELDDIEGVAWFLGIYTRVIMKAGLIKGSFSDIIMPCMRLYFNKL
mgnify:CR=1 FL=1